MSSSYPKHWCFHRIVTFLCALLIIGSFVVIIKKDCQCIPLPSDDKLWQNNNISIMEEFFEHFYDTLKVYHIIVICADILLFLLAFINIAPNQEDLRFGFHLLVIIILGGITLLTAYASYVAFYMPCHSYNLFASSINTDHHRVHHSSGTGASGTATTTTGVGNNGAQGAGGTGGKVKLHIYPHHSTKDKISGINAYVEWDVIMLGITGIDGLAAFLLFLSTVVLCLDAREEAIQDEYVARVRSSIY
ncbi:uncharacterized protein LOC128957062 [Oppia nitens]|uniref:uncharacterized protein LOC128957062 n=1 Tax=Oppia nitens TaxID=1686743 RepID=UPI0023DC0D0C|nr:uncharacterized protein LOC128957062 [Oppia nitens]